MMEYFNPTSVTFWSGLGLVGYGIALIVNGQTEDGIKQILTGLTAIGLRRAVGNR